MTVVVRIHPTWTPQMAPRDRATDWFGYAAWWPAT